MQVADSTSSSLVSTASTAGTTKNAFSALDSDDFLKLMLAELSKQDPLQPNDTKAMIDQLSSLQSIQSNQDLSANMKALVSQNELSSAAGLIGKTITGFDAGGERVEGRVARVIRTSDGAELALADGTRVAMSRFNAIAETTMPGAQQ